MPKVVSASSLSGWLWVLGLATLGCPSPSQSASSDGGPPSESTTKSSDGRDATAEPSHQIEQSDAIGLDVADLERIKERGTLRVLVRRDEESFLPRTGTPALRDIEMAEDFAARLGVEAVFVVVDAYEDLIPALLEGRGDLIAAQLTVTKARREQIAFSRSTFGVTEVVVGRQGAKDLPKSVEELAGRTVHVRASSSYAETLRRLQREQPGLDTMKIGEVAETEDAEDIVFAVTNGDFELTVVDSHILTAIETYNPRFVRLFSLADKREIAWAVRKTNDKLRVAVDRFVLERALTFHRKDAFAGDLDGIRKRKVLRVLTRNNPITYFLYKGRQFGFDYELARMMADKLGVRLEIVVPPSREHLVPWLLEGRGDLIAATMTDTEARRSKVAFSRPYLFAHEVLVQKAGTPALDALEALAGKKVHVRRSSSYYETLQELQKRGIAVEIVEVDEAQETETLIRGVATGDFDYTVADDYIFDVEVAYGVKVQSSLTLTGVPTEEKGTNHIAFALRPDAPQLLAFVNGFVKSEYRGLLYNVAKSRYFKNTRTIRAYRANRVGQTGRISPYDALIKRYAARYGFDWRLMVAQAYVESRFDPNAKSWVGAQGLFQVMPRTGKSLGFTQLHRPESGVHAGIKYMRRLMKRFDPKIPLKDRVRLALAAYNAGLGHVYDAQRLAKQKGWNPNRWFGNVEKAMLLLSDRRYFSKSRHGYCRGQEPVKYVSHIQSLYDAYVEVTKQPATP